MHVVLIPGELINLQFLSHNLEPETLGSRSRSLNTRIIAKNKKTLSREISSLGRPMTSCKKRKTYSNYDVIDKKIQNFTIF